MNRFSNETEWLLRSAGWFEGRSVPDLVDYWQAKLESHAGFTLSPVARQVLNEFGGLHIMSKGAGLECARSDINLNPLLAEGEEDRFFTYFSCLNGKQLFPLGEAVLGHSFAAIDSTGEVFLIMDQVHYVAESFDLALESLLLGGRTVFLQ
jgi:hypothetical protein